MPELNVPELNASELPLCGRRLIQASAGTGKTHTILSLVLRALVGQQTAENSAPLALPNILIVTFTRAATGELRQRMQSRLQEAIAAFADAKLPEDAFLRALRERSGEFKERNLKLLEAAQYQLDEMSVFTIHGFCYRVLSDWAFESGLDGQASLTTDEYPYLLQATRDFWRKTLYPASPLMAAMVATFCKRFATKRIRNTQSPDALLDVLQSYIGWADLSLDGNLERTAHSNISDMEPEVTALLQSIRLHWQQDKVHEKIAASDLRNAKGKPGWSAYLDAIDKWSEKEDSLYINVLGLDQLAVTLLAELYTQKNLQNLDNLKRNAEAPVGIENFTQKVEAMRNWMLQFYARFYQQALTEVKRLIQVQKRQDNVLGYADVLSLTVKMLGNDRQKKLAKRIREKYPIALIDEFQDTDPEQWQIFQYLYPDTQAKDNALMLIGDPKQAIFSFRGADLQTYLHARQTVAEDHITDSNTNWRSSIEMLAVINDLYNAKRHSNPFMNSGIAFQAAKAKPDAIQSGWLSDAKPLPALTFWLVDKDTKKEDRASIAADSLVKLLRKDGATLEGQPLQAADVAFLVNDRYEAQALKKALQERGQACIWQERESVFQAQTAEDLYHLMTAILTPSRHQLVRTALASKLLKIPLDEANFAQEADAWQMHLKRFEHFHRIWLQNGILPMLQTLARDYQIAGKQLQHNLEAARVLTDFRQLGELLQEKTQQLGNPFQLQQWFYEQRQRSDDTDDRKLRLESDENLAQIVTHYGAKGLEYKVVMLPFGIRPREIDQKKGVVLYTEEENTLHRRLHLDPKPEDIKKAEQERLSSDLRLLYVALTRAKYACFVGLKPPKKISKKNALSALDYLICPENPENLEKFEASLTALEANTQIVVQRDFQKSSAASAEADSLSNKNFAVASPFKGSIDVSWHLTSYSQLSRHSFPNTEMAPSYQDEQHIKPEQAAEAASQEAEMAYHFPKGAHPGSCLHSILEHWPEQEAGLADYVQKNLSSYSIDANWPGGLAALLVWLQAIRHTPLGDGVCLADLKSCQREMHFYLPIVKTNSQQFCKVLKQYGYNSSPLAIDQIHGMMQGFIDIAFEHQGRFWVADYKSTWLGNQASDYTQAAMQRSVSQHRYDLQLVFYSLAMRRLLRLQGKAQAEAFAGAYCLFLRGLDGTHSTGVFQHRPEPKLLDELDELFMGGAT